MDLAALSKMFVDSSTPTSIAPSQSGAPWQEELRNQIDPGRMQKERIRSALVAAAQGIMGSKGGLLHGMAGGLTAGAQRYDEQGHANDQRRIEAQRQMDQYDQQDEARRLGMLKDALGVQTGMDDREYSRQKDADSAAALADYRKQTLELQRIRAENAGKSGGGKGKDKQIEAAKEFNAYVKSIDTARAREGSPLLTHDEKQAIWDEYIDRYQLHDLYGRQSAGGRTDALAGPDGTVITSQQPKQGAKTPAPPEAIEYLKKHPEFRSDFESKYSTPASSILGN